MNSFPLEDFATFTEIKHLNASSSSSTATTFSFPHFHLSWSSLVYLNNSDNHHWSFADWYSHRCFNRLQIGNSVFSCFVQHLSISITVHSLLPAGSHQLCSRDKYRTRLRDLCVCVFCALDHTLSFTFYWQVDGRSEHLRGVGQTGLTAVH